MLERWSNCVFKSTMHRVLGNGKERYSIPFFLEPSHECLVECLPTCKSATNPPKFHPILCLDYLSQRYNDTHADLAVYKKQPSFNTYILCRCESYEIFPKNMTTNADLDIHNISIKS